MNPANDRWLLKQRKKEERDAKWIRKDDKQINELIGLEDYSEPVTSHQLDVMGSPDTYGYDYDDDEAEVSTLANDTIANGSFFRDGEMPSSSMPSSPSRDFGMTGIIAYKNKPKLFLTPSQTDERRPTPMHRDKTQKTWNGKRKKEPAPKNTEPESPPSSYDKSHVSELEFDRQWSRRFMRLLVLAALVGIFLLALIAVLSSNLHALRKDNKAREADILNRHDRNSPKFDFVNRTSSPTTPNPTISPAPTLSLDPTKAPSPNPTRKPTGQPTVVTESPTTSSPTGSPTTLAPTLSSDPTMKPTMSNSPTASPTTALPTVKPTNMPTPKATTTSPTLSPTTKSPTLSPTTSSPTLSPTTRSPTKNPTVTPTVQPTTSIPTRGSVVIPDSLMDTILNWPGLPQETKMDLQQEDTFSRAFQVVQWIALDPNVATYDEPTIVQRFALASFYIAITGGDMSTVLAETWMTYTPVCSWEVVADELCNSINVPININMATLNLQGTLAPELGMLSDSLRFLELTANNIQGTVPTELGHLTGLVRLRLHANRLTGTIPSEIGNMKNLGTFY